MPDTLALGLQMSDFLKQVGVPEVAQIVAGQIWNGGAAPITLEEQLGTPLIYDVTNDRYTLALDANIATIDAVLLEVGASAAIANGAGVVDMKILAKGPAVVNLDLLVATDADDAAWTGGIAAVAKHLFNNSGIRALAEPVQVSTQTT